MDRAIRTLFIIWLIVVSYAGYAQQAQELFLRANKAYEQGDFAQALHDYQAIKRKGSALWYNMGNCYYQQGDVGRAIACWHRALPAASSAMADDVHYNCTRAYKKLAKEYQGSRWPRCIAVYANYLPLLMVQFLFLVCWLLLCIIFFRWLRVRYASVVVGVLCITIVYLGLILWYHYQQQRQWYGIIIEKTVPLYVGPHAQYHTIGTATVGDKLHIMQQQPQWYKVTKDGVTGWIPSSSIEIIEQRSENKE